MKKDEIKQKRPFAPGIQWQLMLFIGGITLFTLLLVWGIITYALEPQYNRNIRAKLDSKAAAITALIDQSDAEISSRTYQGLYLNDEFWSGVSQTFRDKKINVDGNCVDFSDSTLRRSRLNATMRSDVWPRISTTWPPRSSAAPSSKRTFWRMSATTCAPR